MLSWRHFHHFGLILPSCRSPNCGHPMGTDMKAKSLGDRQADFAFIARHGVTDRVYWVTNLKAKLKKLILPACGSLNCRSPTSISA